MIAAILRAQLLTMRLGRAAGRRSAMFSLITALIWYLFWCFLAASTFEATSRAEGHILELTLRAGLLLVCIYWQVMPVLSASMGAGLDMRKLLLYPAPHATLFQVEVILRVMSGGEMLLVLAGGAAGLVANPAVGGWAAAPRIAMAILLFAMFNVLLSSGLRSVLERLLSRGRVREIVVLLTLAGLMLPRLVVATGSRPLWIRKLAEIREDGLPWTAAAHAMMGQHALAWLFALCAWAALAGLFGRWQFERSLRYDMVAAQASNPRRDESRAGAIMDRFYRFPSLLWGDPLAAIVEKELRTLARSARFRTVFIMGFSFGLLVWLPLIIGRRAGSSSELADHFLVIVSVYALTLLGQVSYWNFFGFDRSAAQIWYFIPMPMMRVIVAKNVASLVFIYIETAVVIGATFLFRVPLPPARLAEALVVVTVCSAYMLALGNISSVQYPRALNPERVSQGGASSRLQSLVFIFYPLALLPVFLAYLARYLLSSDLVFWLLVALAALIGGTLYWIAMESAVATAVRRREYILGELSSGEGPVAST